MNKNKYFSLIEKIETIETLEDFFTKYEPKFGETIFKKSKEHES